MQHIASKLDHDNEFIGGALALDFANTVGGSRTAPTHDHLTRYADVVRFVQQSGAISDEYAEALLKQARIRPDEALQVLTRALRLRDAIWALFPHRTSSERDVVVVSDEAARGARYLRLGSKHGEIAWTFAFDEVTLDAALAPIARSAAELLTSSELLHNVRECESDTCSWLFLDRTRNHSRRWCDMGDCGNRAKSRRFRARKSTNQSAATETTRSRR